MNKEHLKIWRKRMKVTQEKAAELLDISRTHYTKLEGGKHPIPEKYDILCNAIVLDIKPFSSTLENAEAPAA